MSDTEWTVGMLVARHSGYSSRLGKGVVEKLTPSGMPIVGGQIYNKDGRKRGSSDRWSRDRIGPWNDGWQAQYDRERAKHLDVTMERAMRDLDGYSVEEVTRAAHAWRSK